jgi:hypothetical protein
LIGEDIELGIKGGFTSVVANVTVCGYGSLALVEAKRRLSYN